MMNTQPIRYHQSAIFLPWKQLMLYFCQVHHQWLLLPDIKRFLNFPSLRTFIKRHVKAPENLGHNEPHLSIGEAVQHKLAAC